MQKTLEPVINEPRTCNNKPMASTGYRLVCERALAGKWAIEAALSVQHEGFGEDFRVTRNAKWAKQPSNGRGRDAIGHLSDLYSGGLINQRGYLYMRSLLALIAILLTLTTKVFAGTDDDFILIECKKPFTGYLHKNTLQPFIKIVSDLSVAKSKKKGNELADCFFSVSTISQLSNPYANSVRFEALDNIGNAFIKKSIPQKPKKKMTEKQYPEKLQLYVGEWEADLPDNRYRMTITWDWRKSEFRGVLSKNGRASREAGFQVGEHVWTIKLLESTAAISNQDGVAIGASQKLKSGRNGVSTESQWEEGASSISGEVLLMFIGNSGTVITFDRITVQNDNFATKDEDKKPATQKTKPAPKPEPSVAKKNARESGAEFLAENKKRPGVTVTASGLQYVVLAPGKGKHPKITDMVTVHYRGTLTDGREFDSSYTRGKTATLPLNRVVKGWSEGVQLLRPGGKIRLFIPPELAYGDRTIGQIAVGSTLIFEVELISIN